MIRHYMLKFLTRCVIFSGLAGAPVLAAAENRGELIRTDIRAARYDSAYSRLQNAYAAGLPEDSIYYLWAEIYLARGALDTALALNIAAQRASTGPLTAALLGQRYSLYATLGWAKEAGQALDSLRMLMRPARDRRPQISLDSWSGLNQRNTIPRQPFPFTGDPAHQERINNPAQDITLKSLWFFPLANGTVLVPGISYNFSNGIEQTDFRVDSLNHSFGLSLDAKNLWRRFSLGLSLQRRLSIFDEYSTLATVTLSRSSLGSHWLSYSSLLYTAESARDTGLAYQCVWLMHYMARPLTPSVSFALLPVFSCFLTGDLRSTYAASVMYIEDPHASPVVHYTDASCTQTIPIPSQLDMITQMTLLTEYRNASDPQSYFLCAPESYCSFTPSARLSFDLGKGFSIDGAIKGMAYYYLKQHEWTTFSVPYSTQVYGEGKWLAYSRSDGNYYLVQELGNIVNAEKYSGPLDIRTFKKRRIDYALCGEMELEKRLWKQGRLALTGSVTQYRSALQADAPVEIKDLFLSLGVCLRAQFGAADPPGSF
jgi:hypothetical protein